VPLSRKGDRPTIVFVEWLRSFGGDEKSGLDSQRRGQRTSRAETRNSAQPYGNLGELGDIYFVRPEFRLEEVRGEQYSGPEKARHSWRAFDRFGGNQRCALFSEFSEHPQDRKTRSRVRALRGHCPNQRTIFKSPGGIRFAMKDSTVSMSQFSKSEDARGNRGSHRGGGKKRWTGNEENNAHSTSCIHVNDQEGEAAYAWPSARKWPQTRKDKLRVN